MAPDEVVAACGTWKVHLRNLGSVPLDIHAWIQRDDSPYGYPVVGRQSRFDDPNYLRFDRQGRLLKYDPPHPSVETPPNASYVKRKATLNALATGRRTIVVAGIRRSNLQAVDLSSTGSIVEGPAPQRNGPAPDVAAVCDHSDPLMGELAAGTRSGSVVAMTGTSVAAPQIARFVAEQMAQGATNGRVAAIDEATAQESYRPSRLPLEDAGVGRVVTPPRRPRR
jgi:hypothetical protein